MLQILLEMVPTNEETIREMEVWFAFTAYARHKKDMFDANHDGIFSGMRNLIAYLDESDLLKPNADKDIELRDFTRLLTAWLYMPCLTLCE